MLCSAPVMTVSVCKVQCCVYSCMTSFVGNTGQVLVFVHSYTISDLVTWSVTGLWNFPTFIMCYIISVACSSDYD